MDRRPIALGTTRTAVFGAPVNAVTMQSTLEHLRTMLLSSGTHVIAAVNPEKVIADLF